ncbi:hypothetical protein PACTADRAFT_86535 [Pachysolen tannophilus NRRL Y-2460]|uniref:candidapepsin n=1 Tax=Pachysolen tannophilus NRRL Y-2460 TaxID=669874 RepID=A0A1E4TRP9_PACTA|nr:hypothetical protein PACTADRAFT_86535 [Pachysolen tannophilus NRRL Y-2460]
MRFLKNNNMNIAFILLFISRASCEEQILPDESLAIVPRIDFNVYRENAQTFYLVNLKIGSNKQSVDVLVDTGSSDLWVMGSNNPYCSSSSFSLSKEMIPKLQNFTNTHLKIPEHGDSKLRTFLQKDSFQSSENGINCSEFGTFNNKNSKTFRSNQTEFLIQYADYTFSYGEWGHDDVTIGGVKINDLSFAVANQTNSSISVLGIGLEGLETTYTAGKNYPNSYTYANLPSKLVQNKLISKKIYSIYLTGSSNGSILFGAVDHKKYIGTLTTLPVINTLESEGYSKPVKLEIILTGITLTSNTSVGEETVENITSTASPALLDTGTTLTYVPVAVMEKLATALNASFLPSFGYYVLDCSEDTNYKKTTQYTTVDFKFSGVTIKVPITDLLIEVLSFGSTAYCAVGTLPSGDNNYILGDSFLKSAYVVYDLEEFQISLAQFNKNFQPGIENIETIESSVPLATLATDYSNTWSKTDNSKPALAKTTATSTKSGSQLKDSSANTITILNNKIEVGIFFTMGLVLIIIVTL